MAIVLSVTAQAVVRSRSLGAAAQAVMPALTAATGRPVAALWVPDEDGREWRCAACFSSEPQHRSLKKFFRSEPIPGDDGSLSGLGAATGRGSRWRPLSRTDPHSAAALDSGLSSVIVAPLGTSPLAGMLQLFGPQRRVPTGMTLEVVGAVAGQLGLLEERFRTAARLAEAELRIQSIVDAALDGFVSMDASGRIEEFNRAAERIFGYRRQDVLGHPVSEILVPPSLRPFHEAGLERYRHSRQSHLVGQRTRLAGQRSDGSLVPVELEVHEFRDSEPPRFLAFVRDTSDVARVQQALVEAGQRYAEQARSLQRSLLPSAIPVIPGLDVAVRYKPAGTDAEVGGDLYDVFQTGAESWSLAVGDVEGKGLEAAVVTSLVRFTIRTAAMRQPAPADVLSTLNQAIITQQPGRLCTVAYACLSRRRGRFHLKVASAGHPLPLRLRAGGAVEVVGTSGVMLGVLDPVCVETQTVVLDPDDVVVFYTDGITEARSPHGEMFGDEGVQQILAGCAPGADAGEVADRLEAGLAAFQAGQARDDLALAVLRVATR